jgi:hypothetical protein
MPVMFSNVFIGVYLFPSMSYAEPVPLWMAYRNRRATGGRESHDPRPGDAPLSLSNGRHRAGRAARRGIRISRDDEVGRRGIAVIFLVRAGICMIAVPTFSRLVCAAIHAAGVTASHP